MRIADYQPPRSGDGVLCKGFFLTVASFSLVLQGDLLFTVWDWDVATSHDKVGDFTISRQDMAKLWLAEDGSGKEIHA